jgi:hypothetical protein
MTGITEPKFNSSPQYLVKQIQNLDAASNAAVVTPSNTVDLPQPGVIYIDDTASGAEVKVDTINGQTVTFEGVQEGTRLGGGTGIIVKRVYATGTTADTLHVLY